MATSNETIAARIFAVNRNGLLVTNIANNHTTNKLVQIADRT